ncbi:flagellar radial spoke protein 5 isoform X3 [Cucumis melo var. makuwa]|uniref:Flagellar radial spoke protein 5 isoform X3 n=1 Tax=Cucumis melo var. makuwa TaxID=1194695 RepID=A0A5A7TSG9_CUCMM|nr:flagellar radial spoke protein 5 isoform X3 [Cucumis melo var. makuwa]TYJ97720.1 flagellar radial spoke protein 5 isoform X3 [Cucumis melo var. makuwa]
MTVITHRSFLNLTIFKSFTAETRRRYERRKLGAKSSVKCSQTSEGSAMDGGKLIVTPRGGNAPICRRAFNSTYVDELAHFAIEEHNKKESHVKKWSKVRAASLEYHSTVRAAKSESISSHLEMNNVCDFRNRLQQLLWCPITLVS